MTPSMKLLWLALAAFTFGMLCQCGVRSEVTQGAGAAKLISSSPMSKVQSPMVEVESLKARVETKPPEVPVILPLPPAIYYFAATAWNNSIESDYSVELEYTPTNYVDTVTLAWDSVTNATSYTIYVGRSSGNYTNTFDAHTNTQLTVRLRPVPLTNCVITVTTTKATNLMYSFNLTNWIKLNATNYTRTNITPRFWKAVGNGSKVYIKQRLQ